MQNTTKRTETSLNIEILYGWEWKPRPGKGDLTGFMEAISGIKPGDVVSDLLRYHIFAFGETGRIGCSVVGTSDIVSISMIEDYYIVETETTPHKLSVKSYGVRGYIGI